MSIIRPDILLAQAVRMIKFALYQLGLSLTIVQILGDVAWGIVVKEKMAKLRSYREFTPWIM